MSIYKQMHYKLFNTVSDVIETLKQAQLEAEELYISEEPHVSDAQGEDKDGD